MLHFLPPHLKNGGKNPRKLYVHILSIARSQIEVEHFIVLVEQTPSHKDVRIDDRLWDTLLQNSGVPLNER